MFRARPSIYQCQYGCFLVSSRFILASCVRLVSQARLSFSCFNVGGVVIKVGVMCGGEKQRKRVWSNAIQRLVSTVPKTVHCNIHDAVNRENMQVYTIWLLYYILYLIQPSIQLVIVTYIIAVAIEKDMF